MARQPTPWQEMEAQAYHAYREWPLFLKLRLRDLRRHLPAAAFEHEGQPVNTDDDAVAADIALLTEYGLFVPEVTDDD